MWIRQLTLRHFRNYEHLEIECSPHLNVILGPNGQGKTNLVEAIHYACNLESFRTSKTPHLLRNQREAARIQASLQCQQVTHHIQIELARAGRKVWLDRVVTRKLSAYILAFFALAFTPEDVRLFREAPQERRRFFDRTLSFVNPGYFADLQELQEILAQKNALLKSKQTAQLGLWNELLAKISFKILEQRQVFVEQLNPFLHEFFGQMTGRAETLQLRYEPAFDTFSQAPSVPRFFQTLQNLAERELHYGYSLLGPHRDDYRLFLDERGDREFFSQGELRVTNLALKIAINQLFFQEYRFSPILIFDDLFSELDQGVTQKIAQCFAGLKNQIFITSTAVPLDWQLPAQIFHITQGRAET